MFVEEFPDRDLTDDMLRVQVAQKSHSSRSYSGHSTPGRSDCSAAGTPNPGGAATPQLPDADGVVMALSSAHNLDFPSPSSGKMKTLDNGSCVQPAPSDLVLAVDEHVVGNQQAEFTQGKKYK